MDRPYAWSAAFLPMTAFKLFLQKALRRHYGRAGMLGWAGHIGIPDLCGR